MSRVNFHIEIVRRIRIGRFEYIGMDNTSTTSPTFYAGYGVPVLWTREENIAKHFALNKDTRDLLANAFGKARKQWEFKNNGSNDSLGRGDRDSGSVGDQTCDL